MSDAVTEQRTDGYVVRRYRPADRDAFLSLYGEVFGKERSREWFAWRYESSYLSHVPMVVAERDGELVGALPSIAFRLRAGLGTVLALQPADAMVHADHRRHGLLTRMTERALERYEPREPSLLFNFPNDAAAPAFLDLGWVDVGRIPTYYRVQNAGAFVGGDVRTRVRPAVERLASACSNAYLNARDRAIASADVRVERHDAVPGDLLASLYEEGVPNGLHAPRDAEFYGWRFENPDWDCTTYVARRNGAPVAGIVACTQSTGGTTVTKLMDAVPMTHRTRRREAFGALLSAIVRDHADSDAIAAAAATLPHDLLTKCGFHRDDVPPLSWHSTVTRMVARPLVADERSASTVRGFDLADADHWSLSFAEQDTSY